jgi:hypothetical protein
MSFDASGSLESSAISSTGAVEPPRSEKPARLPAGILWPPEDVLEVARSLVAPV